MEESVNDAPPPGDGPSSAEPTVGGPLDLGVLLRGLRRVADLSQRQLAARAKVPRSAVSRIESGAIQDPRFRSLERLVVAAGGVVRIVDANGSPVDEIPHEHLRDMGDRRFPAHLDVRPVKNPEDWWGAWWAPHYTIPRQFWPVELPDYTFDLNRYWRDRKRQPGR